MYEGTYWGGESKFNLLGYKHIREDTLMSFSG